MSEGNGDDIYEIARQHNLEPRRIIDFSASINPLGPSPRARKKLGREALNAILHYPDPECFELRRALSEFHGIGEDSILPAAGSIEFIYSIPRAMKIRKALIVTPAFGGYEAGLESSGEPCGIDFFETTERDGFELNVEGLILALTGGYDALYLCNPNSPTGILTERKDLLRILARTEKEKTWFILDEAFIDFLPGESLVNVARASSRLLILRTLGSLFALPGLRAGYLISNAEAVRLVSRGQPPWRVNAIAQLAAAESVRDQAFISRSQETVRAEREFLVQGLRAIPGFIPYPSAANFLFVQLHPSLNLMAGELRERLIPRGVLIRDCSSFHHVGPYFFRIAVRTRRENQALLRALRRVHRDILKR